MPFGDLVRVGVPQALTGSRIAFGAAAVVAASRGNAYLAATLITLGAVTDGLDGAAARWLGGGTPFGIWFDYFSDYVCYVMAPWMLSRLLVGGAGPALEAALALPLATAAIRYARNGGILSAAGSNVPDLPGLGTVFYAFVPVTAVFLGVSPAALPSGMPVFVAMLLAFSALMNAPVRFPKLGKLRGASPLVLVLLSIQPFWMTRAIAMATLVIGLSYVLLGLRPGSRAAARGSQTSRTRAAM